MVEHDARSVANEILRRAWDDNQKVTHLKVMKLVYYCHGWMLGLNQKPMQWQPVEAWPLGPVVRDVYRSLQRYGGEPINRPINIEKKEYSPVQEDLIDQVWDVYGKFTAGQLSSMTHAPGTPWDIIWKRYGNSAIIPDPIIERYFAAKAEEVAK